MEFAEGFEEEEAQPRPAVAATIKRGVDVDDEQEGGGNVAAAVQKTAARNGARGDGGAGSSSSSNSNSRAGNGSNDSSEEDDIIVVGQSGPAATGLHGSSGAAEYSSERKQQPSYVQQQHQHQQKGGGHSATDGSNGTTRAAPPAPLNLNANYNAQPRSHSQGGQSVPAESGSGGSNGSIGTGTSRHDSALGFSSYADSSSASSALQKPVPQPFPKYPGGEKSPSFALPQPGSLGFGQPMRPNLYNLPQPGSSHQARSPYAPYSGTASPGSSASPYGSGLPNSFSQMNSQYAASAAGLQHKGAQASSSTSRGIPWNMHSPVPSVQPIAPRPIPTPTSASAFGYEHRQPGNNACPPSARPAQAAQKGRGAVIDLTEDGDGDGDGQSSGGDDVVMQKEQMRPSRKAAAEASDDDDLKIVGEKPTEQSAPLCIGQLTGVALILYPNSELQLGPDHQPGQVVAPIPILMLRMQPRQNSSGHRDETIKLYGGQTKTNFGVMEHRLANVLGPMMTRDNQRGLGIWIEGWVMRTPDRSVRTYRLG